MEASLPASMRRIPKGMTVEYLKKAMGAMRAVAIPEDTPAAYTLPVRVEVRDPQGETVFRARVDMWLSLRKADRR